MAIDDTAFPEDEELTAIAIAYKNPDTAFVADEVFPRKQVGEDKFTWTKYDDARGFSVPDTRVGPYDKVPQIKLTGTPVSDRCEDFGIQIPLSQKDLSSKVDARGQATEQATNIVMLDREVRAAALAFGAGNYPAANKVDLSTDLGNGAGADAFDAAGSDPIALILEYLDNCWMRPNNLLISQAGWSKMRVNEAVVSAALGNSGTKGAATRQRVAELLELQNVYVGAGWVNSVKPGKTPVLNRVWGPHALAFYRDRSVTTAGGLTFGLTAQHGTRVAGSKQVDMGLRGGVVVRGGESVKEVIVANRAAMLFQNVVS